MYGVMGPSGLMYDVTGARRGCDMISVAEKYWSLWCCCTMESAR